MDTGRPVGRLLTPAAEHSLRPIQAFLCPFVNVDGYCIDVSTGADLSFRCLI